ncbi:hypothetical protein V6K52_17435 [Knoellia sp. S7-12]|uniref:hypothetical protein n=1 Tax=Knoellia sp. S7-12 TaxID=3126698 RepID=UPI003365D1E0
MRAWPKSTERLFGVSARLLAGASVLTTFGLGLALRMSWQQTNQNYGPDGQIEGGGVPFAQHLTMVMFDLGYRQIGVQLLLAAALVGAAVVVLHRNGSWAQVRLVRWEVLGAGLVTLVPVVGLILANLYVLTPSDDVTRGMADYMGPQPMTELILGNLPILVASVLTLTAAGLWWLRLEPVADGTVDDPADDPAEEPDDDIDAAAEQEAVEQEAAVSRPVPARTPLDSSDNLGNGAAMGYPQDWSPEDFRPPR